MNCWATNSFLLENMNEKGRLLTSRHFTYMSCYRKTIFGIIKRRYDEVLTLTTSINKGEITFEFTDLNTGKITTINQSFEGEKEFPMTKDHKCQLLIKAKGASGFYKIYRKKVV